MLMVRSCASGELSALCGRSDAPVLPDLALLDSDSLGLIASDEKGEPVGGALLTPLKKVAGKIFSFKVAWLYASLGLPTQDVACRLLREAAAVAANRGAKSIQVSVRPKNEATLAACEMLKPVNGVSVVISLQHNGL